VDDGIDRAGGPLTKERSRICRKADHYMRRTLARQASTDSDSESAPTAAPAATLVVIDTNALLDWFVFADPALALLAAAVTAGRVRWITTSEMLGEWSSVLARPLPERWESARKRALTLEIKSLCELWPAPVPQAPAHLRCRDPDDQKFIDLAIVCGARAVVTRDRALLQLRRRARAHGVDIVAPAQWVAAAAAD
jgi:putative PIN family toxin of toxin-antitoxin system